MKQVSVKIPGKIMLAGEYSVLHGGSALAATLDRTMTVRVKAQPYQMGIKVDSNLWNGSQYLAPLGSEAPNTATPIDPLMEVVSFGRRQYECDHCEVLVESDIQVQDGIGSSSALRLGVLTGMATLAKPSAESHWAQAEEALQLQRHHQSHASGYDIATQVTGGLVRFDPGQNLQERTSPCEEGALNQLTKIMKVFVGGKGAPTSKVMGENLQWLNEQDRFTRLDQINAQLVHQFLEAAKHPDQLGALIASAKEHVAFFTGAPHFPSALAESLTHLEGYGTEFGFKTTGAGGEDALIIIGSQADRILPEAKLKELGWKPIAASFCERGIEISRDPLEALQ